MDATSNLNLPFIMAAQAQKHVTHNEALRALDAVIQLMVLDKDLSTPPGSPADGARYIVASSPTGAWSGQAGLIAAYQDAAWEFYTPREGWLAWVADEDKLYVWTGSAWAEFAGGGGGGLGNVVEDTTPQLGGDLDANGRNVGFDNGTGITDDIGNEQVIFHKTASAVNQVGITNAATGSAPQIAAEGSDANIDLTLAGKGSGHPKAPLFGVNATADATTKFVVAAAASLFNHAGNGHQHKINKNAAGDTASLLFQTGTSGRAELGTAGDDDFHFKVSADGSSWNEAIVIDRTTGQTSLPATSYLDLPAGSAPATPASGKVRLYAKTDKNFYQKNDAGTETGLAGGSTGRELLTGTRTYYVRTDGSDSNTGLGDSSGGAFVTLQKAIDTAAGLDLGIYDVTIQVRSGTFTAGGVLKSLVGAGQVIIVGDETTPANVVVNPTNAACFSADGVRGQYALRGMKLQTTTGGDGIAAAGGSQITFQNLNFGALAGAGSAHIRTSTNSKITATGNYAVSGGAGYHWNAQLGGLLEISGKTATFSNSPAITIFAYCLQASVMYIFNNTYTNGNTVTGQQYIATTAGVIETLTGATLPGSTSGSATSPGIKT